MGYTDQKFYTRQFSKVDEIAVTTSTLTASGHVVTSTNVGDLPKFIKRTKVNAIRVEIKTAPVNQPTVSLVFLNGTSTVGNAAVGTNTAGVFIDATMTAANQIMAADAELGVNIVSTGTASDAAETNGTYDVYLEKLEQYS